MRASRPRLCARSCRRRTPVPRIRTMHEEAGASPEPQPPDPRASGSSSEEASARAAFLSRPLLLLAVGGLCAIPLLRFATQPEVPAASVRQFTVATMGASRFVSMMLQKRFAEFSQVPLPVSGREVAHRMLADANIPEVEITATPGQLTDHYNPANKTVNLSEVVYNANSVAAAAVAAHECGHAVQHAKAYAPLTLRSKMVPAVR